MGNENHEEIKTISASIFDEAVEKMVRACEESAAVRTNMQMLNQLELYVKMLGEEKGLDSCRLARSTSEIHGLISSGNTIKLVATITSGSSFYNDYTETREITLGKFNNESQNSCFIATAVYGSISAPEVVILRRWRDEYLLQHLWGKFIILIYYKVGPFLAKISDKSTYLKRGNKFIIDIIIKKIKPKC